MQFFLLNDTLKLLKVYIQSALDYLLPAYPPSPLSTNNFAKKIYPSIKITKFIGLTICLLTY